MPDAELYAVLAGDPAVSAIVAGRVYPVLSDQGAAYPHLVYSRISDVPTTSIDAVIQLRESRYQVSCYAVTRKAALALSAAVIAALHGYRGTTVQAVYFENLVELVDPASGPNGVDLFHVPVDFMVWS